MQSGLFYELNVGICLGDKVCQSIQYPRCKDCFHQILQSIEDVIISEFYNCYVFTELDIYFCPKHYVTAWSLPVNDTIPNSLILILKFLNHWIVRGVECDVVVSKNLDSVTQGENSMAHIYRS